jgi:hypothetical protein
MSSNFGRDSGLVLAKGRRSLLLGGLELHSVDFVGVQEEGQHVIVLAASLDKALFVADGEGGSADALTAGSGSSIVAAVIFDFGFPK